MSTQEPGPAGPPVSEPAVSEGIPESKPAVPEKPESPRRWPPALLKRFPKLRLRAESPPVIPRDVRSKFPALQEDFDVLDKVVTPPFAEADRAALAEQNRHRLFQVLILLGAATLSGFAALQGVFPDARWPGIVAAVLGLLMATLGQMAGELGSLTAFQESRMKAERLRALHFEYLARTGGFNEPDRAVALRRAVLAIEAGKEPA